MSDPYSQYEAGLDRLLTRLGQDHPRYTEVLVLQQRLIENLTRARRYGDTGTSRAERATIVEGLNRLAQAHLDTSFNTLGQPAPSGSVSSPQPAGKPGERERASLRSQLENARENLRLIRERKSEYVIETAIPLDLIKQERRLEGQIADLEGRLAQWREPAGPAGAPGQATGGTTIVTGGGAAVFGDVKVEGGDFVGHDLIITGNGNVVGDGSTAFVLKRREQALEAARKTDDRAAEGAALDKLGSAYAAQGDSRRAVEHYEQAIAVARESNDQRAEALYSQNLGLALLRLAENEPAQNQAYLSRAATALQRAVGLFDAIKAAPLLRARARYHLGRCYYQSGDWREAIALLEQAREVFARHKARPELAHALLELGQLYYQTEDFESAYLYLKDALRLFRRLGDTDGIAVTQEALGSMELQAAHPSEAIALLREARQGYVAVQRDERVRAVDHLLGMADRARQAAERMGATP